MTKFYQVTNAARAVEAGGKKFFFEPTEFFSSTNSTWGIYATEDAGDIALLDALVVTKRIYRLTEQEYIRAEEKKKTLGVSPSLIGLKNWHAPQMGAQSQPAAAPVVVAEPESVEEALAPRAAVRVSPKK
jgi:hypothetical protein